MTGTDYVSQVANFTKTQFASSELGVGTLLKFVNAARIDMFNALVEIAPWKFMSYKSAANPVTFVVADRFVREEVVLVDGTPAIPCRQVAKEELYQYTINSYNNPTATAPIYYLDNLTITSLPAGGTLDIYYIQLPADLALTDTENAIPPEACFLVIQRAVVMCYEKMGMLAAADMVMEDFKSQMKVFSSEYYASAKNRRTNFETKTDIR
ncbi:MAG: hypothetical protein KGJ13_02160 [Patescibacteria group bacterium]|nr:hypothetical protein [Patescibacteria group bacterium]